MMFAASEVKASRPVAGGNAFLHAEAVASRDPMEC